MGLFDDIKSNVQKGWNTYTDTWKKIYVDTPAEIIGSVGPIKQTVVDWVKEDPVKATETVNNPLPQVITQLTTVNAENNPYIQGMNESIQPIWERESTVKIVGEDGAKEIENTLNPTKWVENVDIPDIIPQQAQDTVKKYLPVAALGGIALLVLSAFK